MRTRIATGPPLSADDPHTRLVRHGASLATFFRHEVCVVRVCTCVGEGGGVSVRLTGRERSSVFRRPSACGRCEQGCSVWVRSDLHILALFFLSRLFHNVFAYGMLEIDKPADAWPENFDTLVRLASLYVVVGLLAFDTDPRARSCPTRAISSSALISTIVQVGANVAC